ncbi:MAG: peptide ABC transporter substrate-binding protein [Lachnospiraceae bacterium]|nr:peptide ABC transporter substrate-binding protein [Lachnospiraceae bacterium]
MKKKLISLLLAGVLAFGLIGCGVYEQDGAAAAAGAADSQSAQAEGGEETAAEETGSTAASEKVFRYSETQAPTSLDPIKANCIEDNEVGHMTQECLVRNTAGNVEPGIAESWETSADGLTYTFHLRDALWSDGEPITANDFVYGLRRLMNPETASPYAFIGEYVKNGAAVEAGEKSVEELGISAPDDKTVVIELENNTPYFLSLIGSSCQFCPQRQDVVEKYGADYAATADKSIYSGPFVMVSSENQQYVFKKNENYWNAKMIKLDGAVLNVIPDQSTALAMYESGELDFVKLPTEQVANYDDVDHEYMNGNEDFIYINEDCDNKILKNKNFRLALNYGIDRNTYITLATNGVYAPCNALVMPLVSGAETTYGEEYKVESFPMDGDNELAKQYLETAMKEEGISDPKDIKVEITTTDVEASKIIAEVVQELWTQSLGITVTVRQVTYADIYGSVFPNGDYEVGYGGWGPDYSDPYTYLELFKSDCAYNYSNYKNDAVDKLLEDSKSETDVKKRMDMLNSAEKMLLDDGALVPLQLRQQHYLLNEKITGMNFFFCSINTDWTYAEYAE